MMPVSSVSGTKARGVMADKAWTPTSTNCTSKSTPNSSTLPLKCGRLALPSWCEGQLSHALWARREEILREQVQKEAQEGLLHQQANKPTRQAPALFCSAPNLDLVAKRPDTSRLHLHPKALLDLAPSIHLFGVSDVGTQAVNLCLSSRRSCGEDSHQWSPQPGPCSPTRAQLGLVEWCPLPWG